MGGLQTFQLHFEMWLASHQRFLRLSGLLLLLGLNVGIWGIFTFTLVGYLRVYVRQASEIENIFKTQVDLAYVHRETRPRAPVIQNKGSLASGKSSADDYATVQNPNTNWALKFFQYRFEGGELRSSFLLPKEEKVLMDFFIAGAPNPHPLLEIQNEDWIRVRDLKKLPQTEFIVQEEELSAVVSEKDGARSRSTLLKFELINRSPYHFFNVQVKTMLKEGNTILAINSVSLPKMLSQQKETIAMSWPYSLPASASIVVLPEVNVLDSSNLLVLPEGSKRPES